MIWGAVGGVSVADPGGVFFLDVEAGSTAPFFPVFAVDPMVGVLPALSNVL